MINVFSKHTERRFKNYLKAYLDQAVNELIVVEDTLKTDGNKVYISGEMFKDVLEREQKELKRSICALQYLYDQFDD